eukprot:754516-Hanusia_phi.AAC.3
MTVKPETLAQLVRLSALPTPACHSVAKYSTTKPPRREVIIAIGHDRWGQGLLKLYTRLRLTGLLGQDTQEASLPGAFQGLDGCYLAAPSRRAITSGPMPIIVAIDWEKRMRGEKKQVHPPAPWETPRTRSQRWRQLLMSDVEARIRMQGKRLRLATRGEKGEKEAEEGEWGDWKEQAYQLLATV